MNPELWRQVERVFSRALELPEKERETFLERACGEHRELRREVGKLLAAAEETGEYLERPVLSLIARGEEDLSPGERVGPYRIDRRLGAGGMGVVYLATRDDREFEQKVALKVLRAGHGSAQVLRRFRQERQILAGLEHPHIASLKDGGTTAGGVPYFVMEYVEGEPIDRDCERRRLPMRDRVELVRKVASAVHFFHQHLVLHRDLKPGNILVREADGEPRLLDFGIAKLLGADRPASDLPGADAPAPTGPTPMTLAYASPEQLRGEAVSTASDVYSLGVLLHRLLTGRLPYAAARTRRERLAQLDGALPELSGVSGDLAAILTRALAPEPRERYASAEIFADELRRYLAGLCVRARAPTTGYRLRRFVARHLPAVASALLGILVLAGSSVYMGVLKARAETLKERAEAERRKAERSFDLLVDLFEQADPREPKGSELTVRELLDAASEKVRAELGDEPESRAALLGALGRAYKGRALFEPAEALLGESLEIRRHNGAYPRDLAVSLINLARLRLEEDERREAADLAREAVRIMKEDLLRSRGAHRAEDARILAEALSLRARLMKLSGDLDESGDLYREALGILVEIHGEEHASVARTLSDLSLCLRQQGKLDEAELRCREALRQREALHGAGSKEVAVTLNSCASIAVDRGDLRQAESMFRRSLALKRDIHGPNHPSVAKALNNLAYVLQRLGQPEQAERLYGEVEEIYRRYYAPDHAHYGALFRNRAEAQLALGNPSLAESQVRRALRIFYAKENHWRIADAESLLGACLVEQGRIEEGLVLLRRGYEGLRRSHHGEDGQRTRDARERLLRFQRLGDPSPGVVLETVPKGGPLKAAGLAPGDVLYSWSRRSDPPAKTVAVDARLDSPFDYWELVLEQAPRGDIELVAQRDGSPRFFTVRWGEWTAEVRPRWGEEELETYRLTQPADQEDPAAAARAWQELAERPAPGGKPLDPLWARYKLAETWARARAWEAVDSVLEGWPRASRDETLMAQVLFHLGLAAWSTGSAPRASDYFERALKIREAADPRSLTTAYTLTFLGIAAWPGGGRLPAARAYLERALEIQEAAAPQGWPLVYTLNNLAMTATAAGDTAGAAEYYRRSLRIQERRAPQSELMAITLNNVGIFAQERGDLALAEDHLRRAAALLESLPAANARTGSVLHNLGSVAARRANLPLAVEYYRRALDVDRAHASPQIAATLTDLGQVSLELGRLEEAEAYSRQALLTWRSQGSESPYLAGPWLILGEIAEARHQPRQAGEHYREALAILEDRAPESFLSIEARNRLGAHLFRRGELAAAQEHFERARTTRERLAPGTAHRELAALGRLARAQKAPRVAAEYFERALDLLESQLRHLGASRAEEGRFRARDQYPLFREAASLEVERGRTAAAFHLLERSRAQGFLTWLSERDVLFRDLPPELDRRRRQLADQYDLLLESIRELSSARSPEEVEQRRGEQLLLRDELKRIELEVRRRSPHIAAVQYPRALRLEKIRGELEAGTVLLTYSVAEEKTYLFAIDPARNLEVRTLPVGEARLREDVARLRKLTAEARASSPTAAASEAGLRRVGRALYELLLAPVQEQIAAGERLLLIPDAPLHFLPWSALLLPDGTYVAQWKPIHLAPSATAWVEIKATRPSASADASLTSASRVVAFGDPAYPGPGGRDPVEDVHLRTTRERGFAWSPLPAARHEVAGITALFEPSRARAFLGADATETRLKTLGPEAQIVHIAAHGYVDERFPMNSALILAVPEEVAPGEENGLLQVWEIMEGVRLRADLVVLSACATAVGEELGGEGLSGLTRAFQFAGARTVAASLWNVTDATTAELMVRFYRHLLAGEPKDRALQSAQIELIEGPIEILDKNARKVEIDASAPYYWAAFQLYGDWR